MRESDDMTQHRLVTLRLPTDLIAKIEAAARLQEETPAELIRRSLSDALREAPSVVQKNEMAVITAAFDKAQGWLDLQAKLRKAGFVLRLEDERLGLHEWPSDRFVLWIEEIGHSLTDLMLQYRAPFPGALTRRAGLAPREVGVTGRGRHPGRAA
ncbi:hypothetical protein U717_15090 [Rhodobacter capsulatus R121]|jgi:hypothetical protein|uniref:Ribbon-helix-helix protein, CopG family n=2 Tax=Rhodobacter capsulatus TaxID=1061 RepID=D5ANE8_RHOCB|nr:hypothetical protein [Rhodobacter capsulatus]ETD00817.1 hypothetical protein U714_14935 [Rhodobacter capsulatus DE442]ETD75474.1 hypothetical protein U717_15090 [Rhodobacter capsulatus R121]ETD82158.1 hypothetical protein U703_13040 [Rhodobacter capsulatus YW1]ETD86321.1 hypothetical protein U716_03375 [Rhodobacter capsulatus B6]ETE52871.1 hypothetical protein U715_15075 [Rhodobacter capsulatus Y262]